jgi:hypothetical protein
VGKLFPLEFLFLFNLTPDVNLFNIKQQIETSGHHHLSGAKAPNFQQRPAKSRALKPDLSGVVSSRGIHHLDKGTFSEVSKQDPIATHWPSSVV